MRGFQYFHIFEKPIWLCVCSVCAACVPVWVCGLSVSSVGGWVVFMSAVCGCGCRFYNLL